MSPRESSYEKLEGAEMLVAKLSEATRQDVYDNRTRRNGVLKEIKKSRFCLGVDTYDIISNGFVGNGRTSHRFGAWKCSECEQHYLGFDAAAECCTESDEQ